MSELEKTPREKKHEFWRTHIEAWRQSGLSQRKYCDEAKINLHNFSWWYGKGLKTKPKSPSIKTISFVPAIMKPKVQTQTPFDITFIFPNQTKLIFPSSVLSNETISLIKALGGVL